MRAFGPKVAGRQAIDNSLLRDRGIQIYVTEREGSLCLQIRQAKPKKWRLKSLVFGRHGMGDLILEPQQ